MKEGLNLWSVEWPGILKEIDNKKLAGKLKETDYEGVELSSMAATST